MVNVLFVCMGNICRSPTAEIIFHQLIKEANLEEWIMIDSAGTLNYHAGEPPDIRARKIVKKYGLNMDHLVARQVTLQDFHAFDYIIAMDNDNYEHLMAICPPSHKNKVSLLLSYIPQRNELNVPDPYYGGEKGFELMYELINMGLIHLLAHIRITHSF